MRWGPVAALLACYVLAGVASMQHLSITYDEPRHFRYGRNILALNSTRFDDSKMPLSALNAAPAAVFARVSGQSVAELDGIRSGRYVTLAVSVLVALGVTAWAQELYGALAGLLALALYVTDPNLLAHSELVTTDVYAAGTITLALYAVWRALARGTWTAWLAAAVALGVAQVAKYTAVALYPLVAVAAALYFAPSILDEIRARQRTNLRHRASRALAVAVLIAVVGLAIINTAFLFNRSGTPLADYPLRSQTFQRIERSIGPIARAPLPLPYPYLEGLDWVMQREQTGDGYGPIYLNGELRRGRGFAGYYLYASLFKVPIGTQLIVIAAIVAFIRARPRFDEMRRELLIFVPLIFYVVYFNFFYRAQIGLRYYLVVFPLCYVFAARLLRTGAQRSPLAVTAIVIAIAGNVASMAVQFPHFIPYVNELIGQRRLAYRVFADSNLDWGQTRYYLQQYLAAHPDAIVEPEHPTTGTILVGVNALTGVGGEPERFKWLRDNFRPVDDVGGAVLVYRIYPADLERARIASQR